MTTECTSIRGRSAGLLAIFVLALQIAGCGQKAEDGPILLKFPHVTAPATPKGQTADRFKQLVEERLQGRVVVEVYPSGQLMDDDDSLDALAFGEVQMIAISLSKLDRLTHKFQIFDLPFLFPDLITVERFQASADGKVLLEAMEDKGLRGLTYWHNGMKQMGAPVPLRTPADAAGLKFRIMESDVLQAQVLQIGGSPQKMALGEVYQALQTGAIDAQENTWSNMYSSKFYEVQKYMTETNHGYLGYLVTVNTSFWDSLPEDIRVELESILREVTEWGNERSETINLEDRQKIVESGISEVVTLTPDELRQWQEAMKPVWTEFEGNIGSSLISAALAARQ
ncbi:MAG: DctP family TRAP transporter solute-binding subunit [Gammaproteobacteria bacterium]|nr:DctP family TRAP transporter solute-binding subunit [Gammaproteobacteria bacterium]MDH4256243.1 DctP family TRAP transporter solute-binding subunit [Gammaproteobacteria bacterium]